MKLPHVKILTVLLLMIATLFTFSCEENVSATKENNETGFALKTGDRVAFVGNTLFERKVFS